MAKRKPDISRETLCPKCGYDPDYPDHDEYRQHIMYDPEHDKLLLVCVRCNYAWKIDPLDIEKPKVVRR